MPLSSLYAILLDMIEVKRGANESSASVLRRFTKRMSGAGIVKKVKAEKYAERAKSALKTKREALKRITKSEEYNRLRKLGKIKDVFYKKSN